ncbi:MAG: TusE/DsrC/DsvC family sulfur relay protein [Methylococcales bacterium]|jgi:tRNA 2-thiouridine synthesizing protein E|nr:TusE/DsrC/DsvC family sulfur relay protein [Methylococcales bacterium]MBT7443961.1 TusE/DsrC/DsvC family sulfur relay protein [Methylococcales bacterium]
MSFETQMNEDGYMMDPAGWTEAYCEWRAEGLNIALTDAHWEIVNLFREFIIDKAITPSARIAQKEAKKRFGLDSKGFYSLFPNGPKQAAMISGGIKPSGC